MNHSPDTNQGFSAPPLTAEDYERLWHYYQYDGMTITIENYEVEVSITLPILWKKTFENHGHRVRICLKGEDGRTSFKMPRLADSTPEVAEAQINSMHLEMRLEEEQD